MPRQKLFTPEVYQLIRDMVKQGSSTVEIAEAIGCSYGSLRVKCSLEGISLRQNNKLKPKTKPLEIKLPPEIALHIGIYAEQKGTTGGMLAIELLEKIVQDDLYKAVLDEEAA